MDASGGASGADPAPTGSGSTGTGTTGPGTVVSPGNGTAVGATIHAAAGVAFSGEVGLLKDVTLPAGMEMHSSIDWGDGTAASDATLTRDSAGVYHVNGTHTYAFGGTYDIAVFTTASPTATPGQPTPLLIEVFPTIQSTAIVSGTPAPGPSGVTLHLTTGQSFSGKLGTFAGPAASGIAGYSAGIDWGDGSFSTGQIVPSAGPTANAGTYDVTGSHTYTQPGTFAITVTVSLGPVWRPGQPRPLFPTRLVATIHSQAIVTGQPIDDSGSASVANGVLKIVGTGGDDQITVSDHAGPNTDSYADSDSNANAHPVPPHADPAPTSAHSDPAARARRNGLRHAGHRETVCRRLGAEQPRLADDAAHHQPTADEGLDHHGDDQRPRPNVRRDRDHAGDGGRRRGERHNPARRLPAARAADRPARARPDRPGWRGGGSPGRADRRRRRFSRGRLDEFSAPAARPPSRLTASSAPCNSPRPSTGATAMTPSPAAAATTRSTATPATTP